jgi:hypothetical protein
MSKEKQNENDSSPQYESEEFKNALVDTPTLSFIQSNEHDASDANVNMPLQSDSNPNHSSTLYSTMTASVARSRHIDSENYHHNYDSHEYSSQSAHTFRPIQHPDSENNAINSNSASNSKPPATLGSQEGTSTQNRHHNQNLRFDIHTRQLAQPIDLITPSSSLIADDDTHETSIGRGLDMLQNLSMDDHPDTTSKDDRSIIDNNDIITGMNNDFKPTAKIEQPPPPPSPPPPSEQTAREQLIERERQGRLERERARLKQQFALARARDAQFDTTRESTQSIDNNSLDVMDLTHVEEEEDERDFENLNFQENNNPTLTTHIAANVALGTRDVSSNHEHDLPSDTVHETSSNVLHMNAHDATDHEGIVNDGGNFDDAANHTPSSNMNAAAASRHVSSASPVPLGFTMERFLKDGVVSSEATPNDSAIVIPNEVNEQATPNSSADFMLEPSSIQIGIADISVIAEGENSSELLSHTGSSDIGGSGISDSVGSASRRELGYHDNTPRLARYVQNCESSQSERNEIIHFLTLNINSLTEADVAELAEIDYASVGNMPPISERDEQHLPDLSGLGRMSNISDHTHSTILESNSMASADSNISQIEGNHSVDESSTPSRDYSLTLPQSQTQFPIQSAMAQLHQEESATDGFNTNDDIVKHGSEENAAVSESGGNAFNMPPNSTGDFRVDLDSGAIEVLENHDSFDPSKDNITNRVIRPGFVNTSNPTVSLHRRAQTTPDASTFVDDFDFCKYNESHIQNEFGSAPHDNDISQTVMFQNISPTQNQLKKEEAIDTSNSLKLSFNHSHDYGSINFQNFAGPKRPSDDPNLDERNSFFRSKVTENTQICEMVKNDYQCLSMIDDNQCTLHPAQKGDIGNVIDDCVIYSESNTFERGMYMYAREKSSI